MNDQPTDWEAMPMVTLAELNKAKDDLEGAQKAHGATLAFDAQEIIKIRAELAQAQKQWLAAADAFTAVSLELERLKAACATKDEALRKYQTALKDLGELSENRITYFEESPSRDMECANRWFALNDAVQAGKDALGDATGARS